MGEVGATQNPSVLSHRPQGTSQLLLDGQALPTSPTAPVMLTIFISHFELLSLLEFSHMRSGVPPPTGTHSPALTAIQGSA